MDYLIHFNYDPRCKNEACGSVICPTIRMDGLGTHAQGLDLFAKDLTKFFGLRYATTVRCPPILGHLSKRTGGPGLVAKGSFSY